MLNLFDCPNLLPFDGEVFLYENIFPKELSHFYFEQLKSEINWKQEAMKIYGKEVLFPRLTAWYAEDGKTYKYSGLLNLPEEFDKNLKEIKTKVEDKCEFIFNSALLNYYRSGNDSMGWHADNEPELGKNPVIASVSIGGGRKMQFKHRKVANSTINIYLPPNSLLLMQGATQHHWLHQIPKTKASNERINITFRFIL
jgi:alkylated DNA repair dioxygenase AlkB